MARAHVRAPVPRGGLTGARRRTLAVGLALAGHGSPWARAKRADCTEGQCAGAAMEKAMTPRAATAVQRRAAPVPEPQPAPTILYGVGYERISLAELCALLASHGVVHVLDVRQSAFSFR